MTKVFLLIISQFVQGHVYTDVQAYATLDLCEKTKTSILSRVDIRPDAKDFSAKCVAANVVGSKKP